MKGESGLSKERVVDFVGKEAFGGLPDNAISVSFSKALLHDYIDTGEDSTVSGSGKVFRQVCLLQDNLEHSRRRGDAWLFIIIESNNRPRPSHGALLQVISGALGIVRRTLHNRLVLPPLTIMQCLYHSICNRHDISSFEHQLVQANESLVYELTNSQNLLNGLDRKHSQWQSCCSIVASLPDPPRADSVFMFTPSTEKESRHHDNSLWEHEDDEVESGDEHGPHGSADYKKWQYVWCGDTVTDRRRITDQLQATFSRLRSSFRTAVSGMDSVEVEICRSDRQCLTHLCCLTTLT